MRNTQGRPASIYTRMGRPYPPAVQAVVTFEKRSQACKQRADRAADRLSSVRLIAEQLHVHQERVGDIATGTAG